MQFNFNIADLVLVSVVLGSGAVSIYRGFLREFLSIVTWVLAVYVGYMHGAVIGKSFASISSESLRHLLGGSIIFFSILIVGGIVGQLSQRLIKALGITTIDKSLGIVIGIVRGVMITIVLVKLLDNTAKEEHWWKSALLVPKVHALSTMLEQHLPPEWVQKFHHFDLEHQVQ
jgi:membrane protein required for colicin V production